MRIPALITAATLGTLALPARADISVVVHRDSEVRQLSRTEVSNLYLGHGLQTGKFPRFLVLERPRDSEIRRRFFNRLNGMDLDRVNALWARLQFSGEALPPTPLQEDRRVLQALRAYPEAIGYVDSTALDGSVREILRIKE